jgi:UDP-3-O-[3-hydroxymyristoyl] glucosamine N-acyltransferase
MGGDPMMYDFEDGNGPVPANRHPNGGGWVADTASVEESAYVGFDARVYGLAQVFGNAEVFENACIYGLAKVYGKAKVAGSARVFDHARIFGDAEVSGEASIGGETEIQGNAAGGVKHDLGKPPLSLIPADVLEEVAKVLRGGAEKYGRHNWRKGMAWSRMYDAARRHIGASECRIDVDPEFGQDHIDHALCALLFLRWYKLHNMGEDDRPEVPTCKTK